MSAVLVFALACGVVAVIYGIVTARRIMAADAGIDLGQAMQAKLATNEKRYPADRARGRHNKYTDYQPDDE